MEMIARYILVLSLLASAPAYATGSRCFSTTCGSATTDKIATSTFQWPNVETIAVWFNANTYAAAGTDRIIDFNTNETLVNGVNTGSTLQFNKLFSITNGTWSVPLPAINLWHSIVITYDGTSTANAPVIYLDGVSQTVSIVSPPAGTQTASNGVLTIGNRSDGIRVWDGKLARLGIWNVILTASEASAYSNGVSVSKIRPSAILVNAPLYGNSNFEPDWAPSHKTLTVTGTVGQLGPPALGFPLDWTNQ